MKKDAFEPHFSDDIKLENRPLVEAWVDVRWELEPIEQSPQFLRDPGFQFALSKFQESVKNEFWETITLPANIASPDMLPHVVRYQFRPGKEQWPLLQIGPGVATVNFAGDTYSTWSAFKDKALYLRSKITEAYDPTKLKAQTVALQYRDIIPFEYGSGHLLEFMKHNLNTSIELPDYIPGPLSSTQEPIGANIILNFNLLEPKGIGSIGIATALKKESPTQDNETESQVIALDLNITSKDSSAPDLYNEVEFALWLSAAHKALHEWFFTLIDGPLRQQFESREL